MQFDGATYHTSKETLEVFQRLKISTIISAPYSYDAAPCELYFARLKRGDMNPENLKLSKSKSIFNPNFLFRIPIERIQGCA